MTTTPATPPGTQSVAAELSALLRSMPGLSTPEGERADWFDRKAALFERIAAEDVTSNGVAAAGCAEQARRRAAELRGSQP